MSTPLVERVERWAVRRPVGPTGHIGPGERVVLALAAGGLLLAARRTRWRTAASVVAGVTLMRSAVGWCPVTATLRGHERSRDALSGARGQHVRAAITIRRPLHEVYTFWRTLTGLTGATGGRVQVTELDPTTTRWQVRSVADHAPLVEWEATVINDVPDDVIGWRTTGAPDVVSAGSVRFVPTSDDATLVRVHLQYASPFGSLGAAAAHAVGHGPERLVRRALADVKRHLEGPPAV